MLIYLSEWGESHMVEYHCYDYGEQCCQYCQVQHRTDGILNVQCQQMVLLLPAMIGTSMAL
jgi:hypothetical protein